MSTSTEARNMVRIFKTLGNMKRVDILMLLAKGEAMSVSEMAEKIHLSVKSTSKHIAMLDREGFLEKERSESLMIVSLRRDLESAQHQCVNLLKKK